MINTLEKPKDKQLARPLRVLVPLIQTDLQEAQDAGMPYYIAAGKKLIEAKAQLAANGEWQKWLRQNFRMSKDTARVYILAAKQKRAGKVFKTLSEVRGDTRPPGRAPEWVPDMKERLNRINVEKLTSPITHTEAEDKLERKLAIELIEIGYRALSVKLHPDKGGSAAAMARLNTVRDNLKGSVNEW